MSVIIYKEGGMRPTLLIGAHVGEISEIRQLKKFLGQSLIPWNFLKGYINVFSIFICLEKF